MNARIAAILKDRISQFTYVDRLAGMVRVGQMERAGQVVKLPIAIDADDDLACDDSTLRDMVPDERYACMVYFEDRGFQRITSRTRGTSYRSTLRLVCWVNTAKFSGDHMASERILQQFLGVVHAPSPVNTDTLVGLRTTAETGPERGGGLFSSYTYPESARPFLMWPFDAFAIDIAAEYRLRPGCEEDPVPGDDECWTPPTTKRRRNPSEFTCEELQDPVTGLTAEQLGLECLDCQGGGGPCEPTTVNGVESDTPAITVLQGGVQVGTLNQATGVHTVPECEDGAVNVNGVLLGSVNSGGALNVSVVDSNNGFVGSNNGGKWAIGDATVQLQDSAANPIGSPVSIPAEGSGTITAPDAVVQLKDSAGNNIGAAKNYRSNSSNNLTAPDGSVQLRDSAANNIGSPVAVRSNQTGVVLTAPDGTVTIQNSALTTLHTVAVRSNGSTTQAIADSVITLPDGSTEGLPATVALDVRNYRSGIVYNFGYILASGQTVSYRTGDEGTYRSAGFFNYTRPVYPLAYAELAAGTWDTLAANNIHGNTLRFTNRAGSAAATSGNRVIQDHLTGLEWYIPSSLPADTTWNAAIDAAEAATVEDNTDWMLPNDRMLDTITRDDTAHPLKPTPFNLAPGGHGALWTATTDPSDTAQARRCVINGAGGLFGRAAKSGNNGSYIFCRKFI